MSFVKNVVNIMTRRPLLTFTRKFQMPTVKIVVDSTITDTNGFPIEALIGCKDATKSVAQPTIDIVDSYGFPVVYNSIRHERIEYTDTNGFPFCEDSYMTVDLNKTIQSDVVDHNGFPFV